MYIRTVSNDLTAAIEVCKDLTVNELFELKSSITKSKKKKIVGREQWLCAIEIIVSNMIIKPFSKN